MKSYNIHEAKTHLSRILESVQSGEEVIISKAGKPIAKLVPIDASSGGKRRLGQLKGRFVIGPGFDDPLPDDILDAFYNGPIEP
jgi:prevent-host-death family protein